MAQRKSASEALPDQLVLKDVTSLKALADPARLQILIELSPGARTVKEVAEALEVPPTRLYYHFKILEKAGLIRVAARRMVSGIEERRYAVTATSWTVSPEATPTAVASGLVAALMAMVRAELEMALLSSAVPIGDEGSPVPILALTRLVMSPREVDAMQRQMRAVIERYGSDKEPDPGQHEYHGMFAAYLRPNELHPSADPEPEDGAKQKRGRRAP
ncbi:MAG TPA: winged helix-turn-helix domain-containing protein [Actinomycetota bacterium]|nr:winged helix-turn-helix domain-containing protein [Actinomycetota bacterium]